jgi:hypothetical protein
VSAAPRRMEKGPFGVVSQDMGGVGGGAWAEEAEQLQRGVSTRSCTVCGARMTGWCKVRQRVKWKNHCLAHLAVAVPIGERIWRFVMGASPCSPWSTAPPSG